MKLSLASVPDDRVERERERVAHPPLCVCSTRSIYPDSSNGGGGDDRERESEGQIESEQEAVNATQPKSPALVTGTSYLRSTHSRGDLFNCYFPFACNSACKESQTSHARISPSHRCAHSPFPLPTHTRKLIAAQGEMSFALCDGLLCM